MFLDNDALQKKWGNDFHLYEQKNATAIEETKGKFLSYNGEIIEAMFHAASGGLTESSQNYSGSARPYLQTVMSGEAGNSSWLSYCNRIVEKYNSQGYYRTIKDCK